MSVRIAVWGPAGSGKTSLCIKLSECLSAKHSVAVVFCDRTNPPLAYLFPKHREGNIKSIGTALSAVEITEEKIMSSATVGKNGNVIYLGYAGGENMYSYPSFSAGRAAAFINAIDPIADYIIFDCPPTFVLDPLTETALTQSDFVFRVYTPALSSFMFYESQLPLMAGGAFRTEGHICVLNYPDGEIPLPESEAKSFMGNCAATLPHCRQIKQQLSEGTLPGGDAPRNYRRALQKLVSVIYAGKH